MGCPCFVHASRWAVAFRPQPLPAIYHDARLPRGVGGTAGDSCAHAAAPPPDDETLRILDLRFLASWKP